MVHISGYTMTQEEVLYSGPPAAYAAAGGSSTSQVSAMVGATGNYSQPLFPGGFWQQGRNNQCARYTFAAICTAQSSATTLTVELGLDTSPNSISSFAALLTYPALTITSYSSGTIYGECVIQNRGSGYGTSSVATNLWSSGMIFGSGNSLNICGCAGPTQLATIDFSVNQWLILMVTMSTNSATNAFTLETSILEGMN